MVRSVQPIGPNLPGRRTQTYRLGVSRNEEEGEEGRARSCWTEHSAHADLHDSLKQIGFGGKHLNSNNMKGGFSFGPLAERRGSAEHARSRPPPALEPDLGGVSSPHTIKSSKETSFRRSGRNAFDHIQEVKEYVRKQNELMKPADSLKSRAVSQGERQPLITDTFGKGARASE